MRWKSVPILLVLLVLLTLSACDSGMEEPAAPDEPTVTASPAVPVPSATVVWYLPTPTNPPPVLATAPPTPDMRPGVGELLFVENFHETDTWSGLVRTDAGSTALEGGQMTITVRQPKTRLASLLEASVPPNAYVEITTRTNLCSGGDEYGLIFRMNSNLKLYRYALSCDGQVQLARVADGVVTYPRPWTPSGDVPLGAPGVTRLAVWLDGKEMRFFLNDAFQFSARDPAVSGGRLGVFARSAGESPLSISFQDLAVFSLESPE